MSEPKLIFEQQAFILKQYQNNDDVAEVKSSIVGIFRQGHLTIKRLMLGRIRNERTELFEGSSLELPSD